MRLPEKKSLALMKALVERYFQPNEISYDPFAGTYATGGSYRLLKLHRRFLLGNKDEDCLKFGILQLEEVFARQLLNPESDIFGTTRLEDVERLLRHSVDMINAMMYVDI